MRARFRRRRVLPPRPVFAGGRGLRGQRLGDLAAYQPLAALVYVVFDLETTGLKPSGGDEILQLGAVKIRDGAIAREETFDQLVDPGRPIPRASIPFHGITDDKVADAPPAVAVLPRFRDFCGDAVMVAHNAAFDLRFLDLKEAESGARFDGPVLDTMLLSNVLERRERDHSIDGIARRWGIDVSGRHTALGDALATAEILLFHLELLRRRGVDTLGGAVREQMRARRLRLKQRLF